MKDPESMTPFELDCLWTWGRTKAEVRDAMTRNSRNQEAAQDAALLAEWREAHPQAICPSSMALKLARLWQQFGR